MFVLEGHTNAVQALAYLPDGRTLVSAGDDRTIRRWDIYSGKEVARLLDHTNAVLSLSVSPDGTRLASGGHDKVVRLWDLEKQALLRTYPRFDATVNAVCFNPTGDVLASGCDRSFEHLTLQISSYELDARWSRGGSDLAPRPVWSLAFDPATSHLAVGWGTGAVELLEVDPERTIAELPHVSGVTALAFSPDGTTLASLSGNVVTLWDLPSAVPRLKLEEHCGRVTTVAFAPDGSCLATGSWDSTVRLWDAGTGHARARFDWQIGRINAVAFAPDGMTAAVAGAAPDIVIWDVDTY